MYIIFCLIISAHAGILGDFCAKCLGAIVVDDPHQFEQTSLDFVIRSAEQLTIAKKWRALNEHEQSMLKILTKELEMRRAYGPDLERNLADDALIRLAR